MSLVNLKQTLWRRHQNKWSGWTRVLLFGALLPAIWFHSLPFILIVFLGLLTNPFWFPEPKENDRNNFMSLAVEGEKLWLQKCTKITLISLTIIGFNLFAGLVLSLWINQLHASVILFFLILVFKFIFLWRMTLLAEK